MNVTALTVTVAEASRLTGYSRRTILRSVRRGELKAMSLPSGRGIRIATPALNSWIERLESNSVREVVRPSFPRRGNSAAPLVDLFLRSGRARGGVR